ncbi:MAG: hypothetical protein SFW36_09145 [Leptolyngbyaceae cyanobacterium bins.59]|nr:hypothetical protein [Leptolyngbyaceae cyanobacterium bins.59]
MKREVVRDFLNLPGIAGVALMDGRSRPYFCGVDQSLNFQQKEALVQGITQVVETTPEDFESFEFQFTGHQVYIYKLDRGMVLLVLARSELVYADYLDAVQSLTTALREDLSKAIATFRLLASDITMTGQNYWKGRSAPANPADANGAVSTPSSVPTNPTNPSGTTSTPATPTDTGGNSKKLPPEALASTGAKSVPTGPSTPVPASASPAIVELKEVLTALNQLSQFTTQYLGTAVITNYWKSSRPGYEWLQTLQIDRTAKFSLTNPGSQALNQALDPQQQAAIREWVAAFVKRCSQVIRDFPTLVDQSALDDRQKTLLL